jgi:hypothetical protein
LESLKSRTREYILLAALRQSKLETKMVGGAFEAADSDGGHEFILGVHLLSRMRELTVAVQDFSA